LKRIFFIFSILWLIAAVTHSQNIVITGESPNYYLKVDEVFSTGVRISDILGGQLQHIGPESKVMIIQMTGVTIDTSSATFKTTGNRTKDDIQNTGKFEILQVDEVVTGPDTIIYFTDNLTNAYNNGEKIQLVKLIEGETVTVNGVLTAKAWNGNVGGIIGIIGIDSVKLSNSSSINASARGFRGGLVPVEFYTGSCRYGLSAVLKDTLHFRSSQLNRSGNRGEGIITASWPYSRGTAFNINGGGAGNGLYSGGGGGSNYNTGGDGGQQSSSCAALYPVKGGWGGYNCLDFYTDPVQPKIIMGGGGGSGTRMSGSTASRGGNGGGIVLIITETLVGSAGVSILANGESAAHSLGSGGGGGGAGTILIDATNYIGSPIGINVRGGGGANSTNPTPSYGGGGSGSGGVFWHSRASFLASVVDTLASNPGSTGGGPTFFDQIGVKGGNGAKLENLIVPLTGFLFNSIRGIDTICAFQKPDTITASQPKGGNGLYSSVWEQSTNNITWTAASGVSTLRYFAPVALSQTTYFRRIVSSVNPVNAESINDTSRTIEIFVYPAIANNSIIGTDTICFHINAAPLTGIAVPLSGGNNIFSYIWQESTDQEEWTASGNEAAFDPAELEVTTYYRRVVQSTAYCHDTTDAITITVLPSLQNNNFSVSEFSICENGSPGRLDITPPTGGDGVYTYQWQYRTFPGAWTDLNPSDDSVRYTIGNLTDTTAYRRIVYSGNDQACLNVSDSMLIIIRALISNNFIEGSAIRYVCYNSDILIPGSNPAEGFGPGTYNFAWEESSDNANWDPVTGSNDDYQSEPLTATRYFRRVVYSSLCTDTSSEVEVHINPLPEGNVFSTFDTLCAGDTLYVKFNVTGNGPFDVIVDANGEVEKSVFDITGPVDSVYFMPQTTKAFVLISVVDDSSCMADATGFSELVPGIVFEVPEASAGTDSEICDNSTVLQATKTNPLYNGLWTGPGVFSNDTLEHSEVTIDVFGSYIFTWTEKNWQCIDDDEVEIIFHEQPQLPDAGPDQTLDFVYLTQLSGSVPSVGNGVWTITSGSGIFSDSTNGNTQITELSDNTTVKWTISNGNCPAVDDSINIIINPLRIAKGFTPNGDLKNDFFDLRAVNAEKISLKVFNSTGNLVYESDNYNSGVGERWSGENMNGVKLPEGTYFYIATIKVVGKEEEVQFKSFVEILRD
jgi:gliding motility-associated-like protein